MSIANPPNISEKLEQLNGFSLISKFGEANVATSTETLLTSDTVATGKRLRIKGINVEGNGKGLFRLYVNSVKVWQARLAWTHRSFNSIMDFEATAGQLVELKVLNRDDVAVDYSGGFYGYEIDV